MLGGGFCGCWCFVRCRFAVSGLCGFQWSLDNSCKSVCGRGDSLMVRHTRAPMLLLYLILFKGWLYVSKVVGVFGGSWWSFAFLAVVGLASGS